MVGAPAAARRLRLTLAYDGTDYCGWQVQPGKATIQGTVEHALSRIQGDIPVRIRGAGRTDSGVHARGQVADFSVATAEPDDALLHALGRMLPPDIRPVRVETVDDSFDAQRHALSKTYAYRLDRSAYGDPFRRRFALHWGRPLDLDAVSEALACLPGRRDWSGFTAAACTVNDRVRDMTQATLEHGDNDELRFLFSASGFLTHLVRNLVGTLLEIGRGRMPVEQIPRILESGNRCLAGPTAPAQGLCLERVEYRR